MRIPLSSYRVQLNSSFNFEKLQAIIEYISLLGITDIYASPITKAKPGSTHGYDVVDHSVINPELGDDSAFEQLVYAIKEKGMGWIQDFVPNHMAYSKENSLLMDIFEHGPYSRYYEFFDIEWNHPYESLRGRVLAPFLGPHYGEALLKGEITLGFESGSFYVRYYNIQFPLKIESYATILTSVLDNIRRRVETKDPDYLKLLGVVYTIKNISSSGSTEERLEQVSFIKYELNELYTKNSLIRVCMDRTIELFNSKDKTEPEHFLLMDKLLSEQYFRFSHWRVASEEINYRRFFTINDLISLRMEKEEVFEEAHSFIFRLIEEGKITGLRIDHIDGLLDPEKYLVMLRRRVPATYTIVEKILRPLKETLPIRWQAEGTTGYDFLALLTQLFCNPENGPILDRIYSQFTGIDQDYEDLLREKKRFVIGRRLAGDLDRIALILHSLCSRLWFGPDVTIYGIRRALVEVLSCFPVYRTYISDGQMSKQDKMFLEEAVGIAKQTLPELSIELDFILKFFLRQIEHSFSESEEKDRENFIKRFQQLSCPLMAKGLEDCLFYVYNRLLSLNEVGNDPSIFGICSETFHSFLTERAIWWPFTFNATSTHDTKRGEDARARINVLSEIPLEWEKVLYQWREINKADKSRLGNILVPDANAEYFIYQCLVGHLPFDLTLIDQFLNRFKQYFVKASREATSFSGWQNPNTVYEEKCCKFIESLLNPNNTRFWDAFIPFQKKIAHFGIINSLSQLVLKLSAPGIPDFYQGTELWDFSFVDPDNRRPIDFDTRKKILAQFLAIKDEAFFVQEMLKNYTDGRIKLWITYKGLQARKKFPEVFCSKSYIPLIIKGSKSRNGFAFLRCFENKWALVVVPKFCTELCQEGEFPMGQEIWQDTAVFLPEDAPVEWVSLIAEEGVRKWEKKVRIAEALNILPVGMWYGEGKKM
ncbi:malto-oligosyltrehalose synthase [Methylacidiphilum caldifontis]|uniref:malto-oligosyltrehalose synthase n=1 Tax=Methylacidiphilum caldifontis TaxID=2795386 RepID=UPI001A908A12|nr:malto-oligosyltrehalose synthase [Methylacidiphilum caldifontis]QSR89017.1 malto-oligosyltrehalose synthase [Methylacidiphilum caldifontis]